MGKGQKARLAQAQANSTSTVSGGGKTSSGIGSLAGAVKSAPVFVPGRGLVQVPQPQQTQAAPLKPQATGGAVGVKGGGLGIGVRTPSPACNSSNSSSSTPAVLTIDNKAVLQYLALPERVRLLSLEKLLQLDLKAPVSSSISSAMTALSISQRMCDQLDTTGTRSSASEEEEESVNLSLNAAELASISYRRGLFSPDGARVLVCMIAQVMGGMENGLILLNKMMESHERSLEPFVVPLIGKLLEFQADKSVSVRELSMGVAEKCVERLCTHSPRIIFPSLIASLSSTDWRVKVAALTLMDNIAARESGQLSILLPQIIPVVSECMKDPKKQVRDVGEKAMHAMCSSITNEDIIHLVPQLVSVISHPEESMTTLDLLMETTFVATVDAATLALITPLLIKSLKERSSPMKRKAARVIDNMCRLVQNPEDVAPFMPYLLPALDKVVDENSNIEIVEVAQEAREILVGVMKKGAVTKHAADAAIVAVEIVQPELNALVQSVLPFPMSEDLAYSPERLVYDQICQYVSSTTANFIAFCASDNDMLSQTLTSLSVPPAELWQYVVSTSSSSQWADCVVPYITPILPISSPENDDNDAIVEDSPPPLNEAEMRIASDFRLKAMGNHPDRENEKLDDSANDLCNIEFSLAFGGKLLLHNAFLKLGKGHVYGIMGKNGAGKTTLLTNIGSGNIEGLPDTLKTVYVQHDDQSRNDEGLSVLDEMMRGKDMIEASVGRDEAHSALSEIGFTESMLASPRSALSGGWKMKLLIIRAMLSRADVLLLDEPTNHLDTSSVDWLANYLQTQKTLTAMIVSHDPAFLDRVITDVIHYENRKLVYYPGSLKDFVKLHPEAKYYYELAGSTLKFTFPTPDRLDGISSTTKTILKMEHVSYTYPGASSPTIRDASVRVCLASRIAVTGKNGAGKSTLIKMMVQETAPDKGVHPDQEVWKHRNLRIAYVAQHSFHHVEQHLESSPVDYIKWRFSDGFDKEDMTKASTELTDAEKEPKRLGDVDEVLGRRKNGRTMEYECTIVGQGQYEDNVYLPLETLIEMGHQKLVTQCDAKIAAAVAGLDVRPLVIKEIQGHLDEFNLEAEYGTHSKIRLLSGGQKVKLVLAAAMWNRPHLIVLDEPTNYLDREALAALTEAIKAFSGGVVIISHNSEFTESICTEKWHVENNVCTVEGSVKESQLKTKSVMTRKEKNTQEEAALAVINASEKDGVNLNKTKLVHKEHLKNPRTLEYLSKVEIRKLTKLAKAAGMPLKDYVGKITKESPEWKWL